MISFPISHLRRATLISGCFLAAAVPALAATYQPFKSRAAPHTIVAVKAGVRVTQSSQDEIVLSGTSALPAGDDSWLPRGNSLHASVTFQELGQLAERPVVTEQASLKLHGSALNFELMVPNLRLPGVYRVRLGDAKSENIVVIRGLALIPGACSWISGPNIQSSGGCTTIS